jgi:hypothetical protein
MSDNSIGNKRLSKPNKYYLSAQARRVHGRVNFNYMILLKLSAIRLLCFDEIALIKNQPHSGVHIYLI